MYRQGSQRQAPLESLREFLQGSHLVFRHLFQLESHLANRPAYLLASRVWFLLESLLAYQPDFLLVSLLAVLQVNPQVSQAQSRLVSLLESPLENLPVNRQVYQRFSLLLHPVYRLRSQPVALLANRPRTHPVFHLLVPHHQAVCHLVSQR